jgi:hypothetical protein
MIQPAIAANKQRQTAAARKAFDRKFATPDQRSEYFRDLAQRSHKGRISLSPDEAEALVSAYSILGRIAERARLKLEAPPQEAV